MEQHYAILDFFPLVLDTKEKDICKVQQIAEQVCKDIAGDLAEGRKIDDWTESSISEVEGRYWFYYQVDSYFECSPSEFEEAAEVDGSLDRVNSYFSFYNTDIKADKSLSEVGYDLVLNDDLLWEQEQKSEEAAYWEHVDRLIDESRTSR